MTHAWLSSNGNRKKYLGRRIFRLNRYSDFTELRVNINIINLFIFYIIYYIIYFIFIYIIFLFIINLLYFINMIDLLFYLLYHHHCLKIFI